MVYLPFADGSALTLDPNGNWAFYDKNNVRRSFQPQVPSRTVGATAAVASVAAFTVGPNDASFEVVANVLVTTATTHAFTVTCTYTDEGNTSRTLTLCFTLVAGGTLVTSVANANGAVPYMGVPQRIRCKAGTTITIATTGTFTTVTYNVEATIVQVA
jgi:hypothetical protein